MLNGTPVGNAAEVAVYEAQAHYITFSLWHKPICIKYDLK